MSGIEPTRYRIEGDDRPWLVFRTWRETHGARKGALLLSLIYDAEQQHPFDVRTMYSDDPRISRWLPGYETGEDGLLAVLGIESACCPSCQDDAERDESLLPSVQLPDGREVPTCCAHANLIQRAIADPPGWGPDRECPETCG